MLGRGYAGGLVTRNHPTQISAPINTSTILPGILKGPFQLEVAGCPSSIDSRILCPNINILENRLTKAEVQKTASSFYGVQGAWYTVGWKMSVLIERTYGRAKLIECICDQRKLLRTYNKAAAKYNRKSREPLALWSASVINGIKRGKS